MDSCVRAVTLKGTLLKDSSWRVAVTTISSRPPEAAGAGPALPVSACALASVATAPRAPRAQTAKMMDKNNNRGWNEPGSGFERVAGITSP